MRFLSVDLGDKRTGIAAGDDVTRIVSPVDVLQTPAASGGGETLLARLARLIEEHAPSAVVFGLPLNMDGSEGPRSKATRDFAARLAARIKPPIDFQDERLTSAAADWEMAQSGLTHKQKKLRRDALAACVLLRDYLARPR